MSDWSEFLTSSDFNRYHQKVTDAIAKHLYTTLTKTNAHPEYLKGCLELSKKVLNLPLTFSEDEKLNEVVNINIKKNFASITAHLMRE